jgi:hypothetical protein
MVGIGIAKKGLGLLRGRIRREKILKEESKPKKKFTGHAKQVDEVFQGKKYKYAGALWKAKQRALPANVKKSIQRKQDLLDDAMFRDRAISAQYKTSKSFGSEKKRAKGRYFHTLKGAQGK